MTTWGTGIKSNDTSLDIYFDFFQDYNDGHEPKEIAEKIILKNNKTIQNASESNNFWLALSLALWETKSLDPKTFSYVKSIIDSGSDLELWESNGATRTTLEKRRRVLENFLFQISKQRDVPIPRKKKIIKEPIFKKGTCLTFKLPDSNFGGAVVLESDETTGFGYCLVATTRIHQKHKPSLKVFKESDVLLVNYDKSNYEPHIRWYFPDRYKTDYAKLFEIIGTVQVELNYTLESTEVKARFSADWSSIIEACYKQLEYEKTYDATPIFPLKKLIVKRKWYKFF